MSKLLDKPQITEIKKIIDGYRPNPEVLEQFRRSDFAVIAGPAAAGKDTLRRALIEDNKYKAVLSTTTRPPRDGEQDGRDYNFVDYPSIKAGLKKGEFFQVALVHNQQVSCLHVDEIRKLKGNRIGLSILIVRTEKELRVYKQDIRTVFLVPPGLEEMMKRIRETRDISQGEIDRRLAAARNELRQALDEEDYYCIVSDGYEKVRKLAGKFLSLGQRQEDIDLQARAGAKRLLGELNR